MLCLLRLAGGITLTVGSFLNLPHEPDYFALQDRLAWLVTATFSVGAGVDVFVAGSLCVYVYRWKTEPVMKTYADLFDFDCLWNDIDCIVFRTSQLINRIMFWSIRTFVWLHLFAASAHCSSTPRNGPGDEVN